MAILVAAFTPKSTSCYSVYRNWSVVRDTVCIDMLMMMVIVIVVVAKFMINAIDGGRYADFYDGYADDEDYDNDGNCILG